MKPSLIYQAMGKWWSKTNLIELNLATAIDIFYNNSVTTHKWNFGGDKYRRIICTSGSMAKFLNLQVIIITAIFFALGLG